MKTLFTILGLLFALTAKSAIVIIPIEGLPNTNNLPLTALFVVAVTNNGTTGSNNMSISYGDLMTRLSNAIPVFGTNFYTTNIIVNTNGGGGESLWTNRNGVASLILGTTNSLKVMTNGLQGIFLGDTNIGVAYFGWPSDGQTYLSVLDGSTGHLLNRWTHGDLQRSTTNGSYAVVTSQSGVSPTLTEAFVVLTNGAIASEFDINMQKTGSYLLLGGNVNDGFVGIQNGAQVSAAIGGNQIHSRWGGADTFLLGTNGALSTFGNVTNYGHVYDKLSLTVNGVAEVNGNLFVSDSAVFAKSVLANGGAYTIGLTNTGGFQTIGNIRLGNNPSDLTTSSNNLRTYGPVNIHSSLLIQDTTVAANKIMYLSAARTVGTVSTVDPTELGYLDLVNTPIAPLVNNPNVVTNIVGTGGGVTVSSNGSGTVTINVTSGGTGGNYETKTNGVRVALGTNVNWTAGVTGYVSGVTLNLGIDSSGFTGSGGANQWTNQSDRSIFRPIAGSTNFIGGGTLNEIATNTVYATVSGGYNNLVESNASYSAIGGGYVNLVSSNSSSSTIAGGQVNKVFLGSPYAAIGGGFQNEIRSFTSASTIAGGQHNTISSNGSAIGGGLFNESRGKYSVIGGGIFNVAANESVTVGGGDSNSASGNQSTVAGGLQNTVSFNIDGGGTIGGGHFNGVGSDYSTISGGFANGNSAPFSYVGGGYLNKVNGNNIDAYGSGIGAGYGTISGGSENRVGFLGTASPYSFIGGGRLNVVYDRGAGSTIVGGMTNQIDGGLGMGSFIGGGSFNLIANGATPTSFGTVVGGFSNSISSSYSFIGGGKSNSALYASDFSTIGGGYLNLLEMNATYSGILGGYNNKILTNTSYGAIGGGRDNVLGSAANLGNRPSLASTISGGFVNVVESSYGTIGGGNANIIYGDTTFEGYQTIGGGSGHQIGTFPNFGAYRATIAGGGANAILANSEGSAIGGGDSNNIGQANTNAVIAGGKNNTISSGSAYGAILGGIGNTINNATTGDTEKSIIIGSGMNNTNRMTIQMGYLDARNVRISTNFVEMVGLGTLYRSNSLALPTAAQIGAGGFWIGNSNGTAVKLSSANGTTTAMYVFP